VSISSNQPSLNNSCEKYRACGVNERQEVNPLIALSDSERVNDLEKDEFRFSGDYLAYDFNDSCQSEHREQEQKINNDSNGTPPVSILYEVLGNPVDLSVVADNPCTRWRVPTSPEDRLSLPSVNSVVGQDNSTSAFNSFHIAGSHFKVYSDEVVSSNSRSEIPTAVSDGQGGVSSSRDNDVGGVGHTPVLTRTAPTSTDINKTDSVGALSFRSAADPISRPSSRHDTDLGSRNGGSREIDRNT
jgi:hypothetical protein